MTCNAISLRAAAVLGFVLFAVLGTVPNTGVAQAQQALTFYPWYSQGWDTRPDFDGWTNNTTESNALVLVEQGANLGRYVKASSVSPGFPAGLLATSRGGFVPPAALIGNYGAAGINQI